MGSTGRASFEGRDRKLSSLAAQIDWERLGKKGRAEH